MRGKEIETRFLKNRRIFNVLKRTNQPVPEKLRDQLLKDDEWLAINLAWWRRNYPNGKT